MTIAAGTVASLHRWPVKSMGGEPVATLRVDGRGVAGDRAYALLDAGRSAPGRPVLLTAREAPRLLAWRATYDGADVDPEDPPPPTLHPPGGGEPLRWDDPALAGRLSEDLSRGVELVRDVRGQQDLPETVLVTTAASHAAVDDALGGLDLRRWRPNLHLDLADAPAHAEERWQSLSLVAGEASFELLHPCPRCAIATRDPDTQEKRADILRWLTRERDGLFGINARPRAQATVRVGDPVSVDR